jgi:hypothetical protein
MFGRDICSLSLFLMLTGVGATFSVAVRSSVCSRLDNSKSGCSAYSMLLAAAYGGTFQPINCTVGHCAAWPTAPLALINPHSAHYRFISSAVLSGCRMYSTLGFVCNSLGSGICYTELLTYLLTYTLTNILTYLDTYILTYILTYTLNILTYLLT